MKSNPLEQEVKLRLGLVSRLMYVTKDICYKEAHDPIGGSLNDDHKGHWFYCRYYLG
jgi:hypothetical protein